MKFNKAVSSIVKAIKRDPGKQAFLQDAIDALRTVPTLTYLSISGVEVSQAIQYWHSDEHLTDSSDQAPDNSVKFVVDKPAYVRVYVSSGLVQIDNVRGSITIQKRRYGVWVDTVPLGQQWPFSITALPDPNYTSQRGSLSRSLNFIIPSSLMRGSMRLKVHVEVPGEKRYTADTTVDIDVYLKQTLHLRGIPVRYLGPDAAGNQVNILAPTLADFQRTLATTLLMFPVSQTPEISLAGIFTFSEPLTGAIANGACPTSWNHLLFWLGIAKAVDGNKSNMVYYGLLPAGIRVGNAAGCGGGGGTAAGFVDDGITMAHEIGHYFNFPHAPGCLPPDDLTFDVNYPAYEPYNTGANGMASIGEYGIDPTTGTIYSPNSSRNFMSYCASRWISLYHYQALMEHQLLHPEIIAGNRDELPPVVSEKFRDPRRIPDPTPPWEGTRIFDQQEAELQRYFVVTGFIEHESIEVRSVLKIETRQNNSGRRMEGYTAELLDAHDQVITRTALVNLVSHACGCGSAGHGSHEPSGVIQAIIPASDAAKTLRIRRHNEEVWTRRAPEQPVMIENVTAWVEENELLITWQVSASDQYAIERVVRCSSNNGKDWQTLAVNLPEDRAVVPVTNLAAGITLIEVIVSDGFNSATGSTDLDITHGEPVVTILWPAEGSTIRTDLVARCWGTASNAKREIIPGNSLCWELDGRPVGEGTECWIDLPEWEGEHRLTLKLCGCDQQAETSVIFMATCSGQRPYIINRQQ
ncbi:MAG: hypothetical protein V4717_19185 [Bacteroidota bacterium]